LEDVQLETNNKTVSAKEWLDAKDIQHYLQLVDSCGWLKAKILKPQRRYQNFPVPDAS